MIPALLLVVVPIGVALFVLPWWYSVTYRAAVERRGRRSARTGSTTTPTPTNKAAPIVGKDNEGGTIGKDRP